MKQIIKLLIIKLLPTLTIEQLKSIEHSALDIRWAKQMNEKTKLQEIIVRANKIEEKLKNIEEKIK
jgi:hypothetical protein